MQVVGGILVAWLQGTVWPLVADQLARRNLAGGTGLERSQMIRGLAQAAYSGSAVPLAVAVPRRQLVPNLAAGRKQNRLLISGPCPASDFSDFPGQQAQLTGRPF